MQLDTSKGCYWIGHPGNLHPITDEVGEYEVADVAEPVMQTSLGGGLRVREPRARARRAWTVAIPGARVNDVVNIRTLLTATMGPYVWVDSWAQVTNLLTPEESVLTSVVAPADGLSYGGGGWRMVGTDNRWAVVTRSNPSRATVKVGTVPIPPAWAPRTVTASAWIASSQSARVVIEWLDGSGNRVSDFVYGPTVSGMDGLRRSVAQGVAPWGAQSARVHILNGEVVSMAAVTWTDVPTDWDVGNGVRRVVVSGLSRSSEWTVPGPDPELRRQNLSFTVTETGPARDKL